MNQLIRTATGVKATRLFYAAATVAVLVVAAVARWPAHPQPYLWMDEAWRAYSVSHTGGLPSFIAYMERNAEVLQLSEWALAKTSWLLFQHNPLGYRVWPFLFSLVAIAGALAFMRRAGQPELSFLPALAIAASYAFVYHGREFKPYALDLALTLWSLWAALKATQEGRGTALLLLLSLMAVSSLVFVFVFPAILLFCLRDPRWRSPGRLWHFTLPPLLFAVTYFLFLRPQNSGGTTDFWAANYLTSAANAISLAHRYPDYLQAYTLYGWGLTTLLFIIALPLVSARRRDGMWLLLLTPLVAQLPAAALRIYPILDRPSYYLYGIIAVGSTLAAGGLVDLVARSPRLARRIKQGVMLAAVLAVCISGRISQHIRMARQWPPDTGRASMEFLREKYRPEHRLFINAGGYFTFLFHREECFPPGHPLREMDAPLPSQLLKDHDGGSLRSSFLEQAAGLPAGETLWFYSGYFQDTAAMYQSLLWPLGRPKVKIAETFQSLVTVTLKQPVAGAPRE